MRFRIEKCSCGWIIKDETGKAYDGFSSRPAAQAYYDREYSPAAALRPGTEARRVNDWEADQARKRT